ncbi:hypothetical protein CEQ21_19220 [Niallia circulans]|uniref:Uncharacterized protein n=1 Tax=Niallia circulans TaxID=1397 RepID=A0A553SKP2_NIACI|nr:endolytic transglycosylase MltG [Niallia circulans]TRZ37580.1 hypothetical protein CEQ21_19220 [Niallia circulans]
MNKRSLRSFAFGLFAASSIIGAYTVYSGGVGTAEKTDKQITTEQAEKVLSTAGYTAIKSDEYKELIAAKDKADKAAQQAKADADKKAAEQKETDKADTQPVSYKLKIKSGMNPAEIAETLAKQKIIKDKDEFEAFLIDNDYHTKVQVGTFRVYSDMSFREIAEKITK